MLYFKSPEDTINVFKNARNERELSICLFAAVRHDFYNSYRTNILSQNYDLKIYTPDQYFSYSTDVSTTTWFGITPDENTIVVETCVELYMLTNGYSGSSTTLSQRKSIGE